MPSNSPRRIPQTAVGIALGSMLLATLAFPMVSYAQSVEPQVGDVTNAQGQDVRTTANNQASAITSAGACTVNLLGPLIGSIFGSFSLATAGQGAAMNPLAVQTSDQGNNLINSGTDISNNNLLGVNLSDIFRDDFLNCIARALAHAALQQIAESTVNWINSGFNGSPSFVTNYQQFFTNVADNAAGQYLAGSDLAFLCSPFQLQVKVAIAQAYASGYTPQSCTLTQATGNIEGFMQNFSQGGWPAFLSFTTVPNNNPFGGFMAGDTGFQAAIGNAQYQKTLDLQLGNGFLSFQEPKNCRVASSPPPTAPNISITPLDAGGAMGEGASFKVCDLVNVTPGTAIAQSLDQTLSINTQSLETAKYFDEIINALVSQLIQNVLYNGLSNLSSPGGGYGDGNTGSLVTFQQAILQNVPAYEQAAQTVENIDTQNIGNLNTTISSLQSTIQCWQGIASSTTATTTNAVAQATQAIPSLQADITDLQNRVTSYQNQMNVATSSISVLERYRAEAESTTDLSTMEALVGDFSNAATNQQFIDGSQVTNAQEDQIQLQNIVSGDQQTAATSDNQCHALANQTPTS